MSKSIQYISPPSLYGTIALYAGIGAICGIALFIANATNMGRLALWLTLGSMVALSGIVAWRDPRIGTSLIGSLISCFLWFLPLFSLNVFTYSIQGSGDIDFKGLLLILFIIWFVAIFIQCFSISCITLIIYQFRRVAIPNKDACINCGYLLYGLPEPRCPECGWSRPAKPTTDQ